MQHPVMNSQLLDSLKDAAVRDLAWVIDSPGIVDENYPDYQNHVIDDVWCHAQLTQHTEWLIKLDQDPLELHQFIAAHPTRRLGHYFETLIAFWLMHMPKYDLIATNLQVHDDHRTVGEYDFLFRDEQGEICHWETAVKFYLQVKSSSEQSSFLGPATHDRLDLKLNRIFTHQLLLGKTPEGLRALPHALTLDKSHAFVKGYLFYHASIINRPPIKGISRHHLSGWWVLHEIEDIPQSSTDSHWIIPARLSWLAPARLQPNTKVMTREQLDESLKQHFSVHHNALLLIELTQGNTGEWMEISRGFVVCASWPNIPVDTN